ncbi:hypothetical protein ACK3SF_02900 [Candidatus Nanosalina sp. VS9-1]|uniref:hypothetical protein n=1 Tax=Candidatus Nanosalina sp. VS9-1 TaxID=3388566 RepID=UPI0039E180C7
MIDMYVRTFREMLQNEADDYETFAENVHVVPDAFKASVTNNLTLDQLTDVANDLDEGRYDGRRFESEEVAVTADFYDRIGIIGSEEKIFTGETVYRAPDYHGRGGSKSWSEIVDEVQKAAIDAEREFSWTEERSSEDRGLEEFM